MCRILIFSCKDVNKKHSMCHVCQSGGLGLDAGSVDLPSIGIGGEAGFGLDLGGVDLPAASIGGKSS